MEQQEKQIWTSAITEAIKTLDTEGWDKANNSTKYDLVDGNESYPPKMIFRYAVNFIESKYPEVEIPTVYGGKPTNKFLGQFGFSVKERNETDHMEELITKYKEHIRKGGLNDEIYKWDLLGKFQGRPLLDVEDFYSEIKSINFSNLIYPVGVGVIHHLARENPKEYKECFVGLFNENKTLQERISNFDKQTLDLYRKLVPEERFGHHHDERTIATFLTFHDPNKYTFFKDSFYQKYCKLFGVTPAKKGMKLIHYLHLVENLVEDYIVDDNELLTLVRSFIPANAFQDVNFRLLAQDILYQTLDKLPKLEGIIGLMASDGTGWQEDFMDDMTNADAGIIWNSKRPNGTNTTLKLLKERIEENDSFNLYYSSGGYVRYKATVIDFAQNQSELDEKGWSSQFENPVYFQPKFSDYKDSNKAAKIVFLVSNLKTIEPILASEFTFHDGFDVPRQDNLSPVQFDPSINYSSLPNSTTPNDYNMNAYKRALNQILFGPPGTGKTYNTINRALEVIGENIESENREDVKNLFDIKLKEGQVVFTTFHQSMSYEDFIEGIKPIPPKQDNLPVTYRVVDGILKKACAIAAYNCYKLFIGSETQTDKYSFDNLYEAFIDLIQKQIDEKKSPIFKTFLGKEVQVKEINSNDSIIARAKNSVAIRHPAPLTKENIQKLYDRFKSIDEITELRQVRETVQVTPRITEFYAIFAGLKEFEKTFNPDKQSIIESNESQDVDFDEIQKKFNAGVYNEAVKKYGKQAKPVVLIIDEINRGNVSQIFGELITLIEEDKRIGQKESLEVTLPYSKEKFGVPSNLYIIGTMNTADRSVEALDAALRRRFYFEEMPPRYDLKDLQYPFAGITVSDLLQTINNRMEKLLDKDHAIGHSYFILKENETAETQIPAIFYRNIIPLLQEYFFGDYGKIGLVLGEGFIKRKIWDNKDNGFADFTDSNDFSAFDERDVYEIINYNNPSTNHKIKVNGRDVEMTFEKAIKLLMKAQID